MSTTRDIQDSLSINRSQTENAALLKNRQQDIARVEAKAEQASELAQELHAIAKSQSAVVDRIETSAKAAGKHTDQALEALTTAETAQRNKRRRLFIALGVLLVVGVALGCGFPIGGALGFTGFVAALVGAAIIIAAVAFVSAAVYGIIRGVRNYIARRQAAHEETVNKKVVEHDKTHVVEAAASPIPAQREVSRHEVRPPPPATAPAALTRNEEEPTEPEIKSPRP